MTIIRIGIIDIKISRYKTWRSPPLRLRVLKKKEFNPSYTTESLVRKNIGRFTCLVNFPLAYLGMKNRARALVF